MNGSVVYGCFHVFYIHFARVIVVTPVVVQQSPTAPAANHSFFQWNRCKKWSGDCCDGTALRAQRSRVPCIIHIFNTFRPARVRVIVERLLFQKKYYQILLHSLNNRSTITRTGGDPKSIGNMYDSRHTRALTTQRRDITTITRADGSHYELEK